jgi:hypothetical protein
MKSLKKMLVSVSSLAMTSLCFSQGFVSFNSSPGARVSTNYLGTTGLISGAGDYYFALLVAPTSQTTIDLSLAGWTFVGYGTNTAGLGWLNGNTAGNGSAVPVAGYDPESSANFAVVGWSSNLGHDLSPIVSSWPNPSTYSGAGIPFFGFSGIAQNIILGDPIGPYPALFGSASGFIHGFTLYSVTSAIPEPTGLAIAGIGAGALLFRRRK